MSIGRKIVLWVAFLPGGLIGSLLVFAAIQVVFAAPYLLFDILGYLGVVGGIPAYLASLWVFLYLSWFIAPTKSRVEAWIILVTAAFISLNAILYGISVMDRGCTQLFAAIVGLSLLFRFYRCVILGPSQCATAGPKPLRAAVWLEIGGWLAHLGLYEHAIRAFRRAIRTKPDYARAHNNLGVAYGRVGRWEDAIAEYDQAIRIRPDFADAHYNLGVAYVKLGRSKDATRAFDQAARSKPDLAEAHPKCRHD